MRKRHSTLAWRTGHGTGRQVTRSPCGSFTERHRRPPRWQPPRAWPTHRVRTLRHMQHVRPGQVTPSCIWQVCPRPLYVLTQRLACRPGQQVITASGAAQRWLPMGAAPHLPTALAAPSSDAATYTTVRFSGTVHRPRTSPHLRTMHPHRPDLRAAATDGTVARSRQHKAATGAQHHHGTSPAKPLPSLDSGSSSAGSLSDNNAGHDSAPSTPT